MFVNSPYRPNNGITTILGRRRSFYANGFTTLAAALAANPPGQVTGQVAQEQYTERAFMTDGVVAGVRKNTKYYSYRLSIREKQRSHKRVVTYTSGGQTLYDVNYREYGIGYTGGSNTGLGSPHKQVARKSTYGHWAAVKNRDAMINAEIRAKLECVDKARNQKLDLSESLVDIDKTVLMIAGRAAQVIKAWQKARERDWFGALKELGFATVGKTRRDRLKKVMDNQANAWLEISYGWFPLLSDIYSGVEVVRNGLQQPEAAFSAKRRVSIPVPYIAWEGGVAPNFWHEYSIESTMRHDVQCKYRLKINQQTLSWLTAIGLDNPAYLLWVGTPFTFVVDWLLPIGDWLKSFTTPMGLTFVDGSLSKRTSGSIEMKGVVWGAARPIVWQSAPMEIGIDIVELDREIFNSWPGQLPYIKFPFSNPQRIVSTIALLTKMR